MTTAPAATEQTEPESTNPRTFADVEAILAANLPGYESREPQQRMATAIQAEFERAENFRYFNWDEYDEMKDDPDAVELFGENPPAQREHLFVQAGTGTGKSLGYLIPAILSAVNDGRRIIVSVTTKALQDQISGKDMPFLEAHLPLPFSWMVLKGRSNYFCTNRASDVEPTEVPNLVPILKWMRANPTWDGTRDSLPEELAVEDWQWRKMASDPEDCKDLGCSTKGGCYAHAARSRALDCNIVIVNHALYFSDLMLRSLGAPSMLGGHSLAIFDEAHEMESVASDALGSKFSEASVTSLVSEVRNYARQWADQGEEHFEAVITRVLSASKALFDVVEVGRLRSPEIEKNADAYATLYEALHDLHEATVASSIKNADDYDKARRRRNSLVTRTRTTNVRFVEIITKPFEDMVRWVENERMKSGETRKVIKTSPVYVAPFLYQWLYRWTPTIMVSATLAVRSTFDYMVGRLGVAPLFTGLDVGTPFDFATQARLYVPMHLPEPVQSSIGVWEAQAGEEMVNLIKASQGRALVLFTSYKHMQATFAAVQPRVPYPMKMQGQEPAKRLADWFSETTEGVLFGTRSFFTGVDFQGETCSLVIIAKMPFPVPNEPVTQARCEAIDAAGGDSFKDFTIPVMSLVLQQAAGRLIRHRNDTGVVAILDPRILTKGYGKQIVRDLPPMTLTTQAAEVRQFLGAPEVDASVPAMMAF